MERHKLYRAFMNVPLAIVKRLSKLAIGRFQRIQSQVDNEGGEDDEHDEQDVCSPVCCCLLREIYSGVLQIDSDRRATATGDPSA